MFASTEGKGLHSTGIHTRFTVSKEMTILR